MNIVFDFGGVLFNWQPVVILQRELPHIAPNAERAVFWVAQFFQAHGGDWSDFDRGTVGVPELVRRIATRTGLAAADVAHVVDSVRHGLQPLPDSVALLQRLRDAGHTLYYLSNMPAPFAMYLEQTHEFLGWFTDGVFSSRVHHNKPEPAIFELAARRFAQPPASLVFLDDHEPNVIAARQQGWQALHFTSAAQAEGDLSSLV